ncbi:MAG: type I-E CRISPR-associated protein Cas7/Cse4/CasC [Planctomycetia bacterium]|nr:type I-E CRISPR-associated protein Cas7/Cse4/CasC [Planctomycetia bacterium]
MSKNNPYLNTRVEFHILQSFPVSCLNRDDVGAPKSAMIGGVQRARVSSQCWKRAIRMAMHDLGIEIAMRTRYVTSVLADACAALGATPEAALACGEAVAKTLTKTVKDGQSDTLFYISQAEATAIAEFYCENAFDAKADLKPVLKSLKVNTDRDGVDIALFGRMAASAPEVNVEAAASFAHAISTHQVAAEIEFFTAVDDRNPKEETGSAHMGSLEFNSAIYYRYISVDLGKLYENLNGPEDMSVGIDAFVKALYGAVPEARQTTMAAATPWDYAKIFVRKGHRFQVSFEDPSKAGRGETLLEASKNDLRKQLERIEKLSGSLFGKISEYEFGESLDFSIDDLAHALNADIQKIAKP